MKLYKSVGKCNDQKQYNANIEAAMISTPEGITKNSPMIVGPSVIIKKHSARKPVDPLSRLFDVKQKTTVNQLGAAKKNHKKTKKETYLWYTCQNWKGYTKIIAIVKKATYDCIIKHHRLVVHQSQIFS